MLKVWHCPGHGGTNKGLEYNGFIERHWVMGMARDLIAACEGWPVEHRMAREDDITITYTARAQTAHDWGADLVICHHANGMFGRDGRVDPDTDGLMTFAKTGCVASRDVADAITRAAPYDLMQRKRDSFVASPDDWTKRAHAVISRYTRWGIPTVFVEWGFATSPTDAIILTSPSYRWSLVTAGLAGIARMLDRKGAR